MWTCSLVMLILNVDNQLFFKKENYSYAIREYVIVSGKAVQNKFPVRHFLVIDFFYLFVNVEEFVHPTTY